MAHPGHFSDVKQTYILFRLDYFQPNNGSRERNNGAESEDIGASSQYINSIRQSSENVYARTEALANKQTSFKVMRPQQ